MVKRSKDHRGSYTGNAAKDGFTCVSKRPRVAPGASLHPDRADSYDEVTDMLERGGYLGRYRYDNNDFVVEMGGRQAALRRLRERNYDDNYDNDDYDY